MSEQVLTVLKFCLSRCSTCSSRVSCGSSSRELRGTPGAGARSPRPRPRRARPARAGGSWSLQPDAERGRDQWIDGEATIGRGGGCTISLPADTFVSQVHARVVERDGQLCIEDLGSTNGTFLNGKQVAQDRTRVARATSCRSATTVLRGRNAR